MSESSDEHPAVLGDQVDLLMVYIKEIRRDVRHITERISAGDITLALHEERIQELQRQQDECSGHRQPSEPNWIMRGLAIAGATTILNAVILWILRGGLATGANP